MSPSPIADSAHGRTTFPRLLFEHASTRPNITMRFGWRVGEFSEDADGVTVQAERVTAETSDTEADYSESVGHATGQAETWRAQYLVGVDGGQSHVRRSLGIRYGGHENLRQSLFGGAMMATYIRAPRLYRDCFVGRAGQYLWAFNPQVRTAMVNLNGVDEFMFNSPVPDGATFDEALAIRRFHLACGYETPVEVISNRKWTAGVAVWADRFGSGHRVFLAGDAIHLFTPTGGFGLNTGVDGAANLAWKLAAMVQGWGGPGLLDTYEIERRPIAARNTTAARALAKSVGDIEIRPEIEDDSSAGEAARKVASDFLATFGEEFASIGVQLGVRYDGSPIVFEDGAPPRDSINCYSPSGVPGGRAPHFFLDPPGMHDRRSLFDRFGPGFTLLRFDAKADASELVAAAQRRGVPLEVVDVLDADARDLYGRDLALVRPDQHVCWRGDRASSDADAVIARVIGADA